MKSKIAARWHRSFYFVVIFFVFFTGFGSVCFSDSFSRPLHETADIKSYPLISSSKVKSIILLIWDGMGLSQIAATRIKFYGADGRLHMERMPVTGLMNTHAANWLITDSAAAATAMACGFKTNNGMISVTPDGKKTLTILEACKKEDKSTGLIATSRITHATPAAFCSHVISRDNESEIAVQLIKSRVNVVFGGGKDHFIPRSVKGSEREDNRNLIEEAKNIGYTIVKNRETFNRISGKYILGLFQLEELTTHEPEPSIAEMTQKAIQILSQNKKGFFLMVEGSQIDWDCHKHKTNSVLRKMRLFDEAVKVALSFALNDKNTLVVVTGDHETGGMAINNGSLDGKFLKIGWTTFNHTGVPLPIFAFGPCAERFTGMHDNTEIAKIFAEILNIKKFPSLILTQ